MYADKIAVVVVVIVAIAVLPVCSLYGKTFNPLLSVIHRRLRCNTQIPYCLTIVYCFVRLHQFMHCWRACSYSCCCSRCWFFPSVATAARAAKWFASELLPHTFDGVVHFRIWNLIFRSTVSNIKHVTWFFPPRPPLLISYSLLCRE